MKRITKLGLICILCPAQERWEESLYRLLENILEKFKSINFNDICMTYVHSTTSMKNNWSFYCSKKWFSSVIAMVGSSALMWYCTCWCVAVEYPVIAMQYLGTVVLACSVSFLAQRELCWKKVEPFCTMKRHSWHLFKDDSSVKKKTGSAWSNNKPKSY